jgi:ATP/ADP translocase
MSFSCWQNTYLSDWCCYSFFFVTYTHRKICNNLKVTYTIVRRLCCARRKTATRKRRKKSTNMPTTSSCSSFSFLYDSSFLVYIVILLLLLLLQFSYVVLCLISIGLFCRTRENTKQLSILFSSPPISQ